MFRGFLVVKSRPFFIHDFMNMTFYLKIATINTMELITLLKQFNFPCLSGFRAVYFV